MKSLAGILILATALASGCGNSNTTPPTSTPIATASRTSTSPSATPSANPTPQASKTPGDDMSIYSVESSWTDQEGKSLKLSELRGEVRIMALVYTSCKGACPMLIQDMKAIESKLSAPERARVSFILVSIDPEVDTPEQMSKFAKEQKLGRQWRLLRGAGDDIRELAALLGFKYRKTSKTDYAHSNIITVLSGKGEIIHQQIGLGVDPKDSVAAVHGLVESQDEVMDCCKDKEKP